MGDDRPRAVFADPSYNVKIDGHVCGSGKVKHREFALATGEIHFVCTDWRHMDELIAAAAKVYFALKNLAV